MKLICPSCGAVASAEVWENDVIIRETMRVVTSLPTPVSKVLLGYLSLFRPARRALSWKKALRLTGDIHSLVATGHIQVRGKVARPCSPQQWATGMEQMVDRRGSLSLPLKNHNYLRQIVWDLADKSDAANESRIRQSELSGNRANEVRGQRAVDQIEVKVPGYVQEYMDKLKKKSMGK